MALAHFSTVEELKRAVVYDKEQKITIQSSIPDAIITLLSEAGVNYTPGKTPTKTADNQLAVLARLGISSNGLLVIDGVEQVSGISGGGQFVLTNGNLQFVAPNGVSYSLLATGQDTIPPTLTVSPNGGAFTSAQTVVLNTDESATIYYTLDGSTPTVNSSVYNAPISISASKMLKCLAKDASGNLSAVKSVSFSITIPTVDTTPPNNVTNLTTSNVTQTTLTLSWTASSSSDVAAYDVFNGSTFVVTVMSTNYNVTGLSASSSYTFTVKAKDTAGNIASGTSVAVTTSSAPEGTALWSYDFQVPQSQGTYNLASSPNWTHQLTTADVYGANSDGLNAKMKLFTLGVVDGTLNEPGQEVPRDGFDSFTAPSMHGAFQYSEALQQLIFQSAAMNPYYFRIIKYS
jgi:hypothetical protein